MDANQVLQLGPLQIPVNWLILFAGLLIGAIITEKIARKRNWEKEHWTDLLITLFTTFLLVYKFGWALFDLKRVINNPATLLWTSGTYLSLLLAVAVTLVVFIIKVRKNKYQIFDLMDFGWLTFTITLFLYYLFIMDYGKITNFIFGVSIDQNSNFLYHPINWYKAFWLGILLIVRFGIWSNMSHVRLMSLYVVLGIGLLVITIFDYVTASLIIGMTIEQWVFFIITLIGGIGFLQNTKS